MLASDLKEKPGKEAEARTGHAAERKPKVAVFHCANAFDGAGFLPFTCRDEVEVKVVKLSCSSMITDIYLLKAFEAGANDVLIFACPEGQCRYVKGSIRTTKRVARVKKVLDDIGLGSKHLSLFNISQGDGDTAYRIIEEKLAELICPADGVDR